MKSWPVLSTGEVYVGTVDTCVAYEYNISSDSGFSGHRERNAVLYTTHGKVRCEYCGRTNDSSEDLCKSCGAPLNKDKA